MTSDPSFRASARSIIIALAMLTLVPVASAESNEKVLYSFQGGTDGATPAGGVVFDEAGNIYGTTTEGGSDSCRSLFACGTAFQLAPPAKKGDPWTETVLYVFQGAPVGDGASPFGGLVIDDAGNLFGTTGYGGIGPCLASGTDVGCGTVFELSPPAQKGGAWTETVLYNFEGDKDGQLPWGNLTFDAKGNLYGATEYGGGYGSCNAPYDKHCGTVFELSPPQTKGGAWTEKVLYGFKSVAQGKASGDGANPNGGLIFDAKGAIYGTTYFGGNNQKGVCEGGVGGTGCGTVFKLVPPTTNGGNWVEKILYRFKGGQEDGANPAANAVFSATGDLFGTTVFGPQGGWGTIFEGMKPVGKAPAWTEKLLYRFSDGKDGNSPEAGLILDAHGNLYGTARDGNPTWGSAFRLDPPRRKGGSWAFTLLDGFTGAPDGGNPAASLILDKQSTLYGTTQNGGTGTGCQVGCGTVFEVSP